MIVVCLEGVHGSGKTRICKEFARHGFKVLDEAFVDMEDLALHPQTLLMETQWLSHWFERLLRRNIELKETANLTGDSRETIYIADRSPYSAEFYAKSGGSLLGPVIKAQLKELSEEADIHVFTVNIKVCTCSSVLPCVSSHLLTATSLASTCSVPALFFPPKPYGNV
eukprot:TRINITY_DN2747_c0_g1_i2.p2 TRINITY_DN2747_c0_g1~~TRINITY_DN2747_c0_g1_i2.p2  ORF type:complete len:168 (+),score=35.10 TRINITY_DN2747_c0_g1_i2:187-690(+)